MAIMPVINKGDKSINPGTAIKINSIFFLESPEDLETKRPDITGRLINENNRTIRRGISANSETTGPSITGAPGLWRVEISTQITLPDNLPADDFGTKYLIMWDVVQGSEKRSFYDDFIVYADTGIEVGLIDYAMKEGKPIKFDISLDIGNRQPDEFNTNTRIKMEMDSPIAGEYGKKLDIKGIFFDPVRTINGIAEYEITIPMDKVYKFKRKNAPFDIEYVVDPFISDTPTVGTPETRNMDIIRQFKDRDMYYYSPLFEKWYMYDSKRSEIIMPPSSYNPYMLNWTFADDGEFIGDSQLFILNNNMSQVLNKTKNYIEAGFTREFLTELSWDDAKYMTFLNSGLNWFNALRRPTTFTMTEAGSSAMEILAICACKSASNAKWLEETEKITDVSGAGTTLNYDKTPNYSELMNNMERDIQEVVIPYKQNLIERHILSGTGKDADTAEGGSFAYAAKGARLHGNRIRSYKL